MFLASESWFYRSSTNWFWRWLKLIFKLDILCSSRFGFSQQQFNQKLYSCRGGLGGEDFYFFLASKSCCPKTHWRFLVWNHFDLQKNVSPSVEGRFLPLWSQSKEFIFEQSFRWKNCRFSSLQQQLDSAKIPEDAMNFDLSRYPYSIFSKTTGAIFFVMIPVDFIEVVTDQSNK